MTLFNAKAKVTSSLHVHVFFFAFCSFKSTSIVCRVIQTVHAPAGDVSVTSHTHRDVVLKRLLGLEQAYERVLGDSQLLLQHAHRLANLVHFLLQPVKIIVRTVSYEYKVNNATST